MNSPTAYEFPDDISALTSSGLVYYRIKLENNDGRYAYSNIAVVKLNKTSGIQVWPSPFNYMVNITYNSSVNSTIGISLTDSRGSEVRQMTQAITRGLNQITLNNLDWLSPGVYFIRITDASGLFSYSQKLIR